MTKGTNLGEGEQLILLAAWRVGREATGAAIREEVAQRVGRTLTVSSIYVTLMRLQKKGYAQSHMADPTPVRGGKARRYFTVTKQGIAALQEARSRMEQMWEGMDTASDLKRA
jgi:DNA-binding PadR family transcriptional regulator